MVKEGDLAPSFSLPSTSGRDRTLASFRGRKLVIFFYPKDETPGCTREACGFRDNYGAIGAAGAEIVGVSKDSINSHEKFQANHTLPFELLSDSDNSVATRFGAYGEKKMYGRTVMGTIRSTFLIDENGRVERVWSPVRVDGHVEKVVEALGGSAVAPAMKTADKKKPAAKKPAKKKTAAKKKIAAKKKTAKKKTTKKKPTKKQSVKKKPTKKKVVKKKATKKKVVKKKTAKKKTTKKKTAKKKAAKSTKKRASAPKKRTSTKKKPARRTKPTRRKAAKRR